MFNGSAHGFYIASDHRMRGLGGAAPFTFEHDRFDTANHHAMVESVPGSVSSVSVLQTTWSGSEGGGPEDLTGVPNVVVSDPGTMLGWAVFNGGEYSATPPFARNGANWGPWYKTGGSIVVPADRPCFGYAFHYDSGGVFGPPAWRAVFARLHEWDRYTVFVTALQLSTGATNRNYKLTLGKNNSGPEPGREDYNYFPVNYDDFPPPYPTSGQRDLMVDDINANSALATASADGTTGIVLTSKIAGVPFCPFIDPTGSNQVFAGASPTLTTAQTALNWSDTETVTL